MLSIDRMLELLGRMVILVGAGVVWSAGAQLFLHSDLSPARKVGWTTCLLLVGVGIGVILPLNQVWRKFCLLLLILPMVALGDVLLFRSRRGLSFWIRACGFELCTVFGAAAATRFVLE
jgi:hypothetical protein